MAPVVLGRHTHVVFAAIAVMTMQTTLVKKFGTTQLQLTAADLSHVCIVTHVLLKSTNHRLASVTHTRFNLWQSTVVRQYFSAP